MLSPTAQLAGKGVGRDPLVAPAIPLPALTGRGVEGNRYARKSVLMCNSAPGGPALGVKAQGVDDGGHAPGEPPAFWSTP